ncbi:MAG: AAA family ATPase [Chloroflexaceae bacterium]|nr:AAA family ATPase [Chloroflexaceae bacterium]
MSEHEQAPTPPQPGFRLHRLEVWNWGTFHGKIWSIQPGGSTSLLTGANGSGKSTLVDALLTLLVPNKRRAYNKASGSGRREREEKTYVLGAYGRLRNEETGSRTQFLRGKGDYSVLLAGFANQESGQEVTLAQVFWMHEGVVQKFFVVAQEHLAIEQHFDVTATPTVAELKKRLKSIPDVDVCESFTEYSKKFRKLVGLRSERALDLFNQTVTIKEIDSLNEFVREHMLERTDPQGRIDQLKANYENLTRSHNAILKAEEQLAALVPLLELAEKFRQARQGVAEIAGCRDALPAYFAQQKMALLEQAIATDDARLAHLRARLEAIDHDLETLRQEQTRLDIAISKDEAGHRLQQLEQEIAHVNEWIAHKKKQEARYCDLARLLGIPAGTDQRSFDTYRLKVSEHIADIEADLQKLNDDLVEHQVRGRHLKDHAEELSRELESLQQRKSQIPFDNLRIRSQIATDLEMAEEDLPFAGELLQVRPEAHEWEGAIERLLFSFGVRLLVPEPHYHRVNHYVNQTNLRGRLVFYRVHERRDNAPMRPIGRDSVIHKLAIKPDTPLYDWLAHTLNKQFDYVCCESLERFQRESYAITQSGMMKRGGEQHEKDDRRSLNDRRNFILGWNNLDKIKAIEVERARLGHDLRVMEETARAIKDERKRCEGQQRQFRQFLDFDDFSAIDWKSEEQKKHALEEEQQRLTRSSMHLQQLREQHTAIRARIAEASQLRDTAQSEVGKVEERIAGFRRQRNDCATRLSLFPLDEVRKYVPFIEADLETDLEGEPLTLDTVGSREETLKVFYQARMDKDQRKMNDLQRAIEKAMLSYKNDYPEETSEVDASVEAIDEFRRMLETIQYDDLPRYRQRFKELLDEKIITDISLFKADLDEQVEEIKRNIGMLNRALQTIPYTPQTYIQLESTPNRDAEMQDFLNQLKGCLPDVGRSRRTQADHEGSFQKIKALIEHFDRDPRWAAKVTDVRNRLNFSASERYRSDSSEREHYSDSSGKSGGQKAKLAYTILASAIAYQFFGLEPEGQVGHHATSFRLVVIDEAFSKTDQANARFAMELFKHLGLQLLVVTPEDNIHVVEPYITVCHYVQNREGNASKVYDIQREVLFREKAALLTTTTAYDYAN